MHTTVSMQICLQIAYIFMPVASAITTLTEALLSYLSFAGYTRSTALARERTQARDPSAARSIAPTAVLAPEFLTSAWKAPAAPVDGHSGGVFDGKPYEYLTPWLPRVMFDHIACLVSIGVRMDEVAKSHGIDNLRALDVIKHQVPRALCL
jgi:hypothetical protein